MNIEYIISAIKDGHIVRRNSWKKNQAIRLISDSLCLLLLNEHQEVEKILNDKVTLNIDDLLANDWVNINDGLDEEKHVEILPIKHI